MKTTTNTMPAKNWRCLILLTFLTCVSLADAAHDGDLAPIGNRDGKVTVADALVALRYSLGLISPVPADDLAHGDIAPLNGSTPQPDGKITIADALVALRVSLNLVTLQTPTSAACDSACQSFLSSRAGSYVVRPWSEHSAGDIGADFGAQVDYTLTLAQNGDISVASDQASYSFAGLDIRYYDDNGYQQLAFGSDRFSNRAFLTWDATKNAFRLYMERYETVGGKERPLHRVALIPPLCGSESTPIDGDCGFYFELDGTPYRQTVVNEGDFLWVPHYYGQPLGDGTPAYMAHFPGKRRYGAVYPTEESGLQLAFPQQTGDYTCGTYTSGVFPFLADKTFSMSSCQIRVTAVSPFIEGTFSGESFDGEVFSNGYFRLNPAWQYSGGEPNVTPPPALVGRGAWERLMDFAGDHTMTMIDRYDDPAANYTVSIAADGGISILTGTGGDTLGGRGPVGWARTDPYNNYRLDSALLTRVDPIQLFVDLDQVSAVPQIAFLVDETSTTPLVEGDMNLSSSSHDGRFAANVGGQDSFGSLSVSGAPVSVALTSFSPGTGQDQFDPLNFLTNPPMPWIDFANRANRYDPPGLDWQQRNTSLGANIPSTLSYTDTVFYDAAAGSNKTRRDITFTIRVGLPATYTTTDEYVGNFSCVIEDGACNGLVDKDPSAGSMTFTSVSLPYTAKEGGVTVAGGTFVLDGTLNYR